MSILDHYRAYEDAFEQAMIDDDWSRVEQCFAENAVHESDPVASGRAAVMAKLRKGVEQLDRKMDSRTASFDAAQFDGNTFQNRWTITFEKAGCPDLKLSGIQILVFEGHLISRFRGVWDPEAREALASWMAEHGAELQWSGKPTPANSEPTGSKRP
jgi:hypothetical protein